MKFAVTADGHAASIDLEMDGKGHFSLSIDSDEFGTGSGGGVVTGDHLTGVVKVNGHSAKLDATIVDLVIVGTLDPEIPFVRPVRFTGKAETA